MHLPALDGGTVAVPPHHLRARVAAMPGLRQYQIVHDQAGLHIAAVLREGAPTDTPQREAAMHCALLDTGAAPPPITVTAADSIPREPGPAAKLKTVKVNDPH